MEQTFVRGRDLPFGIKFKIRTEEGIDFLEIPFVNYFYVDAKQYAQHNDEFYKHQRFFSDVEEGPEFIKVNLKDNFKRNALKKALEESGFKTYEADLSAVKRFMIDNPDMELNPDGLKAVFYDIETKDDGAFTKDIRGNIIAVEPILSVYFADLLGNEMYLRNNNREDPMEGEKVLLTEIKEVLERFDIDLAWNGKRFDDTYIKQRNEYHGISNTYWEFLNQMDYMEMVKKNYKGLESYSLEGVSQAILGRGKLDIGDKGSGAIYKSWHDSFEGDESLEKYNREDVILMIDIEKKLKFLDLHTMQAKLSGCFIQETLHNTDMGDMAILRKTKSRGIICKSKPNDAAVERNLVKGSIGGAHTFCLSPGHHKDVWTFDFKSYYATTIAQYNICVSTIGEKEYFEENNIPYVTIPADNVGDKVHPERYFRTDKRGFISELVEEWVTERDKVKYEMEQYIISDPEKYRQMYLYQYGLKTNANSIYGALAFPYFRFFEWDVADSVTTACRVLMKLCIKWAEEVGFIVIQGDTDSIIFKKGQSCEMSPLELEKLFEVKFDEYADKVNMNGNFTIQQAGTTETKQSKHFIVFEHEKTFKAMLAIKKKNYASLSVIKEKGSGEEKEVIKITGLECKKKDTNPLAKILQLNLITDILKDNFFDGVFIEDMTDFREKVESYNLEPEYLIMKKSLGKPLSEYDGYIIDKKTGMPKIKADGTKQCKSIPAHVKLAKRMEEAGADIYPGDRIKFIVRNKVPKIDAVTPEEFEVEKIYDAAYYWERITNPIIKILAGYDRKLAIDNAEMLTLKPKYTKTGNLTKPFSEEQYRTKMKKKLDKIIKEEEVTEE